MFSVRFKNIKAFIKTLIRKWIHLNCIHDHYFIDEFSNESIIVDLGSGHGKFASVILERFPYSKAILVEADPYLIENLSSIFKDKMNIEILNKAIGDKREEGIRLFRSKNFEFNSINKSFSEKGGGSDSHSEVFVSMITLQDIFSQFNLHKIDLLKVDVEGSEWDIFENFSEKDAERIDQISVEFHDFMDPSLRKKSEKCIKKLKKLGYCFMHSRTNFFYGSPYFNCLFYKKKHLKWFYLSRWINISNYVIDKLRGSDF